MARILIVDDNPGDLLLAERALKKQGYAVSTSQTGTEAKRLVEKDPPDLLLTDCFLPTLDGVHLCKFLRADPRFRTLPMILMSGSLEPELLQICRSFTIDAIYVKGEPFETLIAEIERLLKKPSA